AIIERPCDEGGDAAHHEKAPEASLRRIGAPPLPSLPGPAANPTAAAASASTATVSGMPGRAPAESNRPMPSALATGRPSPLAARAGRAASARHAAIAMDAGSATAADPRPSRDAALQTKAKVARRPASAGTARAR